MEIEVAVAVGRWQTDVETLGDQRLGLESSRVLAFVSLGGAIIEHNHDLQACIRGMEWIENISR